MLLEKKLSLNEILTYLIFVIFLHAHILSPGNFTLGKCVNLRQICPATKQRSLSVKLNTECKILH